LEYSDAADGGLFDCKEEPLISHFHSLVAVIEVLAHTTDISVIKQQG
jgi:hypothetical protein